MKDANIGQNHTGAALSPINVKSMLKAAKKYPSDVKGNSTKMEKARIASIMDADAIGSMAPPLSVLKGIKNKLMGKQVGTFLDKLGERLAYERTGVRLYEAAHAKAIALNASRKELKILEHIRTEEAEHMEILKKAIKHLGGDPTVMTPGADLTGVMGLGMMQVLSDSRTDMDQCLNTLLNIELIDNAAWELLIEFADHNEYDKLSKSFTKALLQEQEHLLMIRDLLKDHLK
ncbi:MAG: ferritin-like domain-containing protein [Tatlockia sp.]|nr:ferritin-like domain-containing protein [Tatlockia sp.]